MKAEIKISQDQPIIITNVGTTPIILNRGDRITVKADKLGNLHLIES